MCFFPSYKYSQQLHDTWSKNGILDKISLYKKATCLIIDLFNRNDFKEQNFGLYNFTAIKIKSESLKSHFF